MYGSSELIINPDGSVFHLKLKPGMVPGRVILAGDPGRVNRIGNFLTNPRQLAANREFVSLTGEYKGESLLVLSTGIGTDNIDIVLNELDALVNIDFKTREDKPGATRLKIVRIGTSGALQPDLPVGSFVASRYSVGLDGLLHYYLRPGIGKASLLEVSLKEYLSSVKGFPGLYATECSPAFLSVVQDPVRWGITVAAHGFYGPQGRQLRAPLAFPELNSKFQGFSFEDFRITNFEMESSALYGLSELTGHEALTVCLIIANRARLEYLGDYQPHMDELIKTVLDTII